MAADIQQKSAAVSVALGHVEAWSNHDVESVRSSLAPRVKVTVTSILEDVSKTETT
jgi:hypothetical protein